MRVLLTSDGSAPAEAARRLVERVGDRARVEVTVVNVLPPPQIPAPMFASMLEFPSESGEKSAKQIVTKAAASLSRAGFKADTLVAEGPPGAEIVRLVERGDFDLTVIGAGTRTWLGCALLGSVSMHVLHSSPSSTLIVHEFESSDERLQALVGTDGSSESKLAIDVFCEFANPWRCDTVVASVVHPMAGVTGGQREKEVEHRLTEQGRMVAAEGTERLRRAAFTARPTVLTGSPSTQLLKEAENLGADLVVVGSRGFGPVGRALMGSVSDPVSRHSRAVLVGRRLRD